MLAAMHQHGAARTGGIVSAMFAAGAVGTIASSRMRTQSALTAGTALLLAALTVLTLALTERSIAWLTAAAATAGTSQGIGFRAALASVTTATAAAQRGSVTSSFFAIAYVGGISLPVLGVGAASQRIGLIAAGQAFAAIVGALALAALVWIVRVQRPESGRQARAGGRRHGARRADAGRRRGAFGLQSVGRRTA